MSILETLSSVWENCDQPFLISQGRALTFEQITSVPSTDLSAIHSGDVVAFIGDFYPEAIATLLQLIDRKCIIVPLTNETRSQHDYFFEAAHVNYVIENGQLRHLPKPASHEQLDYLRDKGHGGLVLFSSGTTGKPKAILHDITHFLRRFSTPRPSLITLNFLLFDHIGGLNTLFHTLFNKGKIIAPERRSVQEILQLCKLYNVEVLPTTPTFLRLLLLSGEIENNFPKSIKIISYGTEQMDQSTLNRLCELLPEVDFRQTYGMSEIGIVRVKSEARNSLFMKIGGEGISTKVVDGTLRIHSETRMLGYLNADSPFDGDGWYNTKDVVETKGEYYKITGRDSDIINVGGLKFMAADVESVAIQHPAVAMAKASGKKNPITGQHVELRAQLCEGYEIDKEQFLQFLKKNLPPHMVPRRILFDNIKIGHRFKKLP